MPAKVGCTECRTDCRTMAGWGIPALPCGAPGNGARGRMSPGNAAPGRALPEKRRTEVSGRNPELLGLAARGLG